MIESVIENLDGPAVMICFVFLMLVWRAFVALNNQLVEMVKDSTKAMQDLTAAFQALRDELRDIRRNG